MRQAGRSLPEYRALREGTTMLDSCVRPDMAAEITLQPVRRHGVDAGIFFSDIVVPARLAGLGVEIRSGVGPVFDHPVRTEADIEALPPLGDDYEEALAPIREAVRLTVAELGTTPLAHLRALRLEAAHADLRPSGVSAFSSAHSSPCGTYTAHDPASKAGTTSDFIELPTIIARSAPP